MRWFLDLRLSRKLLVFTVVLLGGAAISAGLAMRQLAAVNAASHRVTDQVMPAVEAVTDLQAAILDRRVLQFRHVASETSEEKATVRRLLGATDSAIAEATTRYLTFSPSAAQRLVLDSLRTAWNTYRGLADSALVQSDAGATTAAIGLLTNDGEIGGRVVGAVGVSTRNGKFVICRSKATVITTGACYRQGRQPDTMYAPTRFISVGCPANAGEGQANQRRG